VKNGDEREDPVDLSAAGRMPDGADQRREIASKHLDDIAVAMERDFRRAQRVLTFGEYLELFASHPVRFGRSAPHYVRDMFAHYGIDTIERPWGHERHFRLFDAPWAQDATGALEPRLVGQEAVQHEVFRVLSNFVREGGRANRLLLMHGPNGSAKSTAAACILRALEHYSTLDEGALYRFHWIFPSRKTSRGSIGFGDGKPAHELESYAHLEDDEIDARLVMELRDHPLFLLPAPQRRALLEQLWDQSKAPGRPSDWLVSGELSHKNKQIFEALLADYQGSIRDVLRHVQVERYFLSRRYRVGAVTLGPEMSVDAGERQITADRSLAALPTSLQATTLFEAHGELVEASGGVLEFSDLLKRPIDAFRYLQLSLETGEVSLQQQTVFLNVVMIANANDIHLAAFREHHEYPSFRGRIELVRVPYLRSYLDEERIYEVQIRPQLGRHVAPHTIRLVAEFAVLTRMKRPDPGRYGKPLAELVEGLTAVEKMDLYALGTPPARLKSEGRKVLRANIASLFHETDNDLDYEGRVGVSPRQVRTLLLDAAQDPEYKCVSPFSVLQGIDELCKRTSEFEWLKLKPQSGGYHDHKAFREIVRRRLMDRIEADMRVASGLIDEQRYRELFKRYVSHMNAWLKREKLRNPVTGRDESPDENIMRDVEGLLGVEGDAREYRETTISMIAAWAIDHPGKEPNLDEIFPDHAKRLEKAAFAKLRRPFAQMLRSVAILLRENGAGLDPASRRDAEKMVPRILELGYDAESAADAAHALVRDRYADIVA
jgi:predicted Ser/Thr protein kinase